MTYYIGNKRKQHFGKWLVARLLRSHGRASEANTCHTKACSTGADGDCDAAQHTHAAPIIHGCRAQALLMHIFCQLLSPNSTKHTHPAACK
jgi:hypothetical protein